KLRARDISPVELTEAYLGRIEQTDGSLHAYITVTDTIARKAAKKAEAEIAAGKWRGPFHGVPITLKDLVYTKGVRTTGGSARRLGRCVRRAQRRRHHRHRHGRIDSDSRSALRMRRAEADLEPRQPLRRHPAGLHAP